MTRLPPLRIPRCLLDPRAELPAADAEGLVTVELEHRQGLITAIRPAPATHQHPLLDGGEPWAAAPPGDPGEVFPTGAALALTPLVDAHVHLDKAWTAAAFPNPEGTMAGALAANLAEIALRRPQEVHQRGERALELAWRYGCRAMRSHVDSLGPSAEGGWEALIQLRDRWAGRLDLQLVALAPLSHWATAEGEALARRVATAGGLLGGVVGPPFERRSFDGAQISALLRLAERVGCGIDLHIDESDRQPARGLRLLMALLERRPCAVPITCSHASSLALLPEPQLQRLAERMARLGLSVVALPLTNLWLLGRRPGCTPNSRPQAPLRQLQAAGVAVAMASDNVRDPWYPGGDFDPVELLRLSPLLSHLQPWRRLGLAPFSSGAARVLDLPWDGVLREGGPADLLVLGCGGWGDLLARSPRRRVLRAGCWLPAPEAEHGDGMEHALAALSGCGEDPGGP